MTNKLFEEDDLQDKEVAIVVQDDEPLKPFLEKYKDEKNLALAIVEKDRFIAQLKGENAELRTEVTSRGRVEEVVDRLLAQKTQETQNSGGNQSAQSQGNESSSKSGLTEDDVRNILERERSKITSEANVEKTKQLLKEQFGSDYAKVLVARAKELGESAEFFDALARKNPIAVMALVSSVKHDPKPKQEMSLFNTGVNTTQQALNINSQSGLRDKTYYDAMKKKIGMAEFMKPAVQNQMHKDALSQGPSFFN